MSKALAVAIILCVVAYIALSVRCVARLIAHPSDYYPEVRHRWTANYC